MHITIAPRGFLQIDDARITFCNFEGRVAKYNREGDRNFALIIPDEETADILAKEGWNVKVIDPRDENDTPFMYLPVKVKFNDWGPNIYLISGRARNRLSEVDVKCLDTLDIAKVDLDIRPYDWELGTGKSGRTAYLQSMEVTQDLTRDRFAARYAAMEDGGNAPF